MVMTLFSINNVKINEILTDNSMDWNFDTVPSQYYDFSFEKIKEKFINLTLAILSICIFHFCQS